MFLTNIVFKRLYLLNMNAQKLILIFLCKFGGLFCWNTFRLSYGDKEITIPFTLVIILLFRICTVLKTAGFLTWLYCGFDFSTLLIRINSLLTFSLHLILKIVEERVYLYFPIFTFLLNLSPFNLDFIMCYQSSPNLVLNYLLSFIHRKKLHPLKQILLLFKLNNSPVMYLCSNSVYKSSECLLFLYVDQVLLNLVLLDWQPHSVR